MAENLQVPHARGALVEEGGAPARSWFTFWSLIGKRLSALAGVQPVTTVDATDLPSVIALANSLKAKLNETVNTQK